MDIYEITIKYITTELLIAFAVIDILAWLVYIKITAKQVYIFTVQEVVLLVMPVFSWLVFDLAAYATDPLITVPLVAMSRWVRLFVLLLYGVVIYFKWARFIEGRKVSGNG